MTELGMNQTDLADRLSKSQGWVSNYLFRNPKKTISRLLVESPDEVTKLADILQWSENTLLSKIGFEIPGMVIQTEIVRSSRTIPTFLLTVSRGRGELISSDVKTYIDEDWQGEFEALILEQNETLQRTLIYQKGSQVSVGQKIIVEVADRGIVVADVVDINGELYYLSADKPFAATSPRILGVVIREQIEYPQALKALKQK
jgi:hypothetical protein